ncbi:VOC family protein [Caulobacter sp. KR2-114]|uniref:VOC family protein n=1 Tax=Caulobacter sp. KR2-114 TaxID=3400912 RepID=UPI003C0E63D8
MTDHPAPMTWGIDHVGLSVRDLQQTVDFFRQALGWQVVGERKDYPAAFVSDGHGVLTLWQVADPAGAVAFDRRANVGLHHLALAVADEGGLAALHDRLSAWPGVVVEFAPQPVRGGPKQHFIIQEPGGLRLEFACDPRSWIEGV